MKTAFTVTRVLYLCGVCMFSLERGKIMKTIFLVLLLVLLIGPMSVEAQEFSALQRKVEDIIKREKPAWKLLHKDITERQVVYRWEWESESGKKGARILLIYASSRKEAEEQLRQGVEYISVGPDRKLTGLGDEAYLWIGANNRSGTIRFRKSNVFIDVSAPSVALAEQLAKQVADLISK